MPESETDEDGNDATTEDDDEDDAPSCPMVSDLFRSRTEDLPGNGQ